MRWNPQMAAQLPLPDEEVRPVDAQIAVSVALRMCGIGRYAKAGPPRCEVRAIDLTVLREIGGKAW